MTTRMRERLSAAEAERIREAFRVAAEWNALWQERYQELLKRYPDQFVAIDRHGDVVAAHPDPLELGRLLDERGIQRHDVSERLVTADPGKLMH